jgi:hypothetical protein
VDKMTGQYLLSIRRRASLKCGFGWVAYLAKFHRYDASNTAAHITFHNNLGRPKKSCAFPFSGKVQFRELSFTILKTVSNE